MTIITKIETIKDWKRVYPPVGKDKQWKDGFSAKELAKIVTDSYPEINFEKSLAEKLHFDNTFHLLNDEMYPEHISKFDKKGRGRHHDLACIAVNNNKRIALCFEAKVNESLDVKLDKYRETDGKKERVDWILSRFFGEKYSDKYKDLYFQLLSSIAGSIAFAAENNVSDVYFILYQICPQTKDTAINVTEHIDAINKFLSFFPNKGQLTIKNNIIDLGRLSIERYVDDDKNKGLMSANVKIAYIKQDVSGKKID